MISDMTGSRWYYIAENWKLKDSDDNQTTCTILITNTNCRPLQHFFEEVAEKQCENDFLIQSLRSVMMQYGTPSSRRASDDDDSGTSTSSESPDSNMTFNEDSLSEICKKWTLLVL
ncbi:uncharacterized protein ARMOST_06786 [Armillaria ostoyae]|uniref:Uncharacterized protein n=1 Tax=Armillaria ostoyae TaxID=47428 RepID=A0A284R3X5_ARMOS|nr:uncharacterized protein ARMOST_06786 [Armillaria ostoyae]